MYQQLSYIINTATTCENAKHRKAVITRPHMHVPIQPRDSTTPELQDTTEPAMCMNDNYAYELISHSSPEESRRIPGTRSPKPQTPRRQDTRTQLCIPICYTTRKETLVKITLKPQ